MKEAITFFNDVGWLANLIGILTFLGGGVAVFYRWVRPLLNAGRIDKVIPADFERKWNESVAKAIARIAIVDDQLTDFPIAELKADGYQVQSYKQVTLSKTAELSSYDIVFLDMKGVVKDDPENGGLRLIADLRSLNPAQKICAVSSKTFDINATEFFRQADDAKKKPLTAHECRSVINAFIGELFSTKVLRGNALLAMQKLSREHRVEVLTHLRKFEKGEMTIDQLGAKFLRSAGEPDLGYRLLNIARAMKHAG